MAKSTEELAHLEWLGYVQPVGLVVSIPALLEAQCYVNKNISPDHTRFLKSLAHDGDQPIPEIRSLAEFTHKVLEWKASDLIEVGQLSKGTPCPEVVLPQYNETLRPTHLVPAYKPFEGQNPWMMLVQELATGTDFDSTHETDSARHWNASPQAKFERLLRETSTPIGLLCNRRQLRIIYAPKGESSGYATFHVHEMMAVAGRPIFAAFQMLLSADRMFSLSTNQRLPAILENSRKYQNTVSTKLAEQVLEALYELMRGFQGANDASHGQLLEQVLKNDPNHVYSGLLTVLMRLVFVMYAEDRDLLSNDPIYTNHYSVTGLFNKLREHQGRFPDTMEQRYGAWAQLITLFRLVHDGGQHGDFQIPTRKGYLFDSNRYPFLEGRQRNEQTSIENTSIPRVSDAVVYNVLRNLLILDGERLSYRTLDVEQIGSVYETVMGFNLEVAQGQSIAIKPAKSHGAPATINLEELLATKGKDRPKWLKEKSDQSLSKDAEKLLKEADTIDQFLEALEKKIHRKVTPSTVPEGAMVLQPSNERRRSGSHYTPRSLTEPIVRTTLEPILKQLCDPEAPLPAVYSPSREDKKRYTAGELAIRIQSSEQAIEYAKLARTVGMPHPSQILDLKICDPAMGSGAFLVEACRQLGDHLIDAWAAHDLTPKDIPPDEDEVLYARRMVSQRCLYGVDKNVMAVDLAKLSMWLVTLAKSHPFTFLDHSLRHGDSLVGLTRKQIIGFHWDSKNQKKFGDDLIQKQLDRATEARAKIMNARENVPYRDQETRMANADEALSVVRLTADACVSAFFSGSKAKERETRCAELFADVSQHYQNIKNTKVDNDVRGRIAEAADSLRTGEYPIHPFHWEIEFPEVFSRDNSGFDAFVGNPPFLGGKNITGSFGNRYLDILKQYFTNTGGQADLVSYFLRKCFKLLRNNGTFGLIATNTVSQGDTRRAGLFFICTNGGKIYTATRRLKWPGEAAVIITVVHVIKSKNNKICILDKKTAPKITAYLFHAGTDSDPVPLNENTHIAFTGEYPYGSGFLFSPDGTNCTTVNKMQELINKNPDNAERIKPYIGGAEFLSDPEQKPNRYVIDFGDLEEKEAVQWPDLFRILEEKVKPERMKLKNNPDGIRLKQRWWQWCRARPALREARSSLKKVLMHAFPSSHLAFAFVPTSVVIASPHPVFAIDTFGAFSTLQSRIHEIWARFFASTLEDRLRYTPTDCFETFPFPVGYENSPQLNHVGEQYYEFRASLMIANNEGLTKTYNRFHDPHEKSPEIHKLRELHAEMDRAVLEAYGWHDLAQSAHCEFLLDYEEDDDDTTTSSRRKKPWRLRWPDEFRDEVLARLLELNEQRHKEELLLGLPSQTPQTETMKSVAQKTSAPKKKSKPKTKTLLTPPSDSSAATQAKKSPR